MPDKQSSPASLYEYPVVRVLWKRGNVTTASIGHLVQETDDMITLAGSLDAYGNPHEIRIIRTEHLYQMHYFGAGSTDPIMYLASPHSHPDPDVVAERYWDAMAATAHFINRGRSVYSPIVHSHPMAIEHNMDGSNFEAWRAFDLAMISRCSEVYVLMLPGWWDSKGVTAEIEYAHKFSIPVRYIDPNNYKIQLTPEE